RRGFHVTGVQPCALPICDDARWPEQLDQPDVVPYLRDAVCLYHHRIGVCVVRHLSRHDRVGLGLPDLRGGPDQGGTWCLATRPVASCSTPSSSCSALSGSSRCSG